MKYPIELEFSSFCSLKCKSCINKDLKSKHFLDEKDFKILLDFLFLNKNQLLCIDIAGLGDTFMHPSIGKFLILLGKKFAGTGLSLNISQKGQLISNEHLDILQDMKDNLGFDINFYVGIFSVRDSVYSFLTGGDSFSRLISFVKELKKRNFKIGLELLNNYFSHKEYEKFFELCKGIGCSGYVKNITNYGGSIKDYTKYLFGYNNIGEYKEMLTFTNDDADSRYLGSKCSNVPYFRADSYITMCSNLHGFPERGILGKISEINKFSSLEEIFLKSQENVFGHDCKDCSMNKNEINFCSKDYYIDESGGVIRDPVLVKLFDIDTPEDLIFIYDNDKEFVLELTTNPEHIHKHRKIDFIQILDLIDNVYNLDFDGFFHFMLSHWKLEKVYLNFLDEINVESLENTEGDIVGNFCKKYNIEPIEFYFFCYYSGKISKNYYLSVLYKIMKYAIKIENSILLVYMKLIVEKINNGKISKNFGKEMVHQYFKLFSV